MSNTSNQSGILSSRVYLQKYTLFILYYFSPKIASIYPNAFLNYMSTQASRRYQGYPPNYRDQISRDHLPPTYSHLPRATPLDFTWSPSVISRSPLRKQAKISLSCQARRKILVRIQAADQPRASHTARQWTYTFLNAILYALSKSSWQLKPNVLIQSSRIHHINSSIYNIL
jgi:hypothetical protein